MWRTAQYIRNTFSDIVRYTLVSPSAILSSFEQVTDEQVTDIMCIYTIEIIVNNVEVNRQIGVSKNRQSDSYWYEGGEESSNYLMASGRTADKRTATRTTNNVNWTDSKSV